jgi:hypothetical protein
MPFDGSGNFSRVQNFVADKNGGVKIVAARMDGEFDNFANGLNQLFLRSGVAGMTGNLNMGNNGISALGNGTVAVPAIRFNTDATSGIFMPGSGIVATSILGVERLRVNNTGVGITGNFAVSGNTVFTGVVSDANSNELGYKDLPQNAQSGAYTLVLTDRGKHLYLTGGAAAVTVPPNASVAFNLGTAITLVNDGSGVRTITQGAGVTLKFAGTGVAGNRILAVGGIATLLKVGTDTWYVSGVGLT